MGIIHAEGGVRSEAADFDEARGTGRRTAGVTDGWASRRGMTGRPEAANKAASPWDPAKCGFWKNHATRREEKAAEQEGHRVPRRDEETCK